MEFNLDKIPWSVTCIRSISTADTAKVIELFQANKAEEWQLEAVSEMIKKPNQAFIQTSKQDRHSLIAFSEQTSRDEFVDSLIHEILHLSRHIEMCGNSESLTTYLGDMGRDIFKQVYS